MEEKEMSKGEYEVPIKEPIRTKDLDPDFKYEIASTYLGRHIKACFKCGACTGGCPVGILTEVYKPRQVIGEALLGMRKEVMTGQQIWLCATCYTCEDRCPQKVNITDVILALRNIAFREGHAPEALIEQAKNMAETGWIQKITASMDKRREELGLSRLSKMAVEDMQKIIKATGFDKYLYRKEEKK
jgi:heterodisulfide reductase subunit C